MTLRLAISPCPNDIFMFYGLLRKKIETYDLEFEVSLLDIASLNLLTITEKIDVCKVSCGVLSLIQENYAYLNNGAAMGFGCGPLLIAREKLTKEELMKAIIATPGETTTAYHLLKHFYPKVNTKTIIFSQIEDAILHNSVGAGVIIHENRFTYEKKGLFKIADLGALWTNKFQLPMPLGLIVIDKKLGNDIKLLVDKCIKMSIEYSYNHFEDALIFCQNYAQEMDKDILRQHIKLYVNAFSVDMKPIGHKAIHTFLEHTIL